MADSQTNSASDSPSASGTDLHLELRGPGLRAGLTNAVHDSWSLRSWWPRGTELLSSAMKD
jgi:hypothetical protein